MKHEQGHMCGGMSSPTACAATEFRYHDHSWAPALHTISYLWTGEMTQCLRSLVLEEDLGFSQHPRGSSQLSVIIPKESEAFLCLSITHHVHAQMHMKKPIHIKYLSPQKGWGLSHEF